MRRLLSVALVALLGCGASGRTVTRASGDPEPVVQPDPTKDGPKPEHLEVVAMTITSSGDTLFVKADGTVERKGQEARVATLRTTGELLHENGGLLLTLNPDGTITSANFQSDEFSQVVIETDGTLFVAGQVINSIDAEGKVFQGAREIAQISGPETGRRAAMLVLLVAGEEASDSDDAPAPKDETEQTAPDGESEEPSADESRE